MHQPKVADLVPVGDQSDPSMPVNDQTLTLVPINGLTITLAPATDKSVPLNPLNGLSATGNDKTITSSPFNDQSSLIHVTEKSVILVPLTDISVFSASVTDQSVISVPFIDQSVISVPVTDQSVISVPINDQPETSDTVNDQPVTKDIVNDNTNTSMFVNDKAFTSVPGNGESITSVPDTLTSKFEYNTILMESGLPYDESEISKRKNIFENHLSTDVKPLKIEEINHIDIIERETPTNLNHLPIIQICDNLNSLAIEEKNINTFSKEIISSHSKELDGSSNTSSDEGNREREHPKESRRLAEKQSAIRSLETNLMLILLFVLATFFYLIPSKVWQTYFCVVETSLQKALLPLITTMTNFGTVRSVSIQFWKSIFKK